MIQSNVVDTSALLPLLRGNKLGQIIDQTYGLQAAPYLHTISIVTHAELWAIVDRNKWGNDKKKVVEQALKEFVTIDVAGAEIVLAYRRIEAASIGITMGKNDIWIVATAVIAGCQL